MRDKVIIIGAILVLGAGIALWRLTQSISAVDADPPKAKVETSTRVEKTEPVASSTSVKRDARIAPPAAVTPRSPSANSGGPAPALEPDAGSGSAAVGSFAHGRMIERELKRQLVRQIDGLEGVVNDCLAQTKGAKPTGASAVTLKIELVKNQPVVTEVAVEPLETTLKDTALNNCLRDTGKKIVLDLPEGITEVTATHKVNLDAGSVTGHDLTAYDFKPWGRPVDPPEPPK